MYAHLTILTHITVVIRNDSGKGTLTQSESRQAQGQGIKTKEKVQDTKRITSSHSNGNMSKNTKVKQQVIQAEQDSDFCCYGCSNGTTCSRELQATYKDLKSANLKKERSGKEELARQMHLLTSKEKSEFYKESSTAQGVRKGYTSEHLYQDAEYTRKKREDLKSAVKNKEEEELKECTFQPRTRKGQGENRARTKSEFLESQSKFLQTRHEKIQRAMEEQLEKETAGTLNKKSKIANEKEWIERFTKKDQKKQKYQDPNHTFKPKVSTKTEKMYKSRGERDTFQELIDDSKKRLFKSKQNLNKKDYLISIKAQDKSLKILYQKFEKHYYRAYRQVLNIDQDDEREINYSQYVELSEEQFYELMQRLNYLDQDDENDMKIIRDFSSQVFRGRFTRKNMLTFFCLIENIFMSWMRSEGDEGEEDGGASYGRLNSGGYYTVSERESQRVFKRFESFRLRRRRFIVSQKKAKADSYQQEKYRQKPSNFVDKNSRKIMERKQWQKNQQRSDDEFTLSKSIKLNKESELIQKGLEYKQKHQRMAEQRKSELNKEQCTFKPTLQAKCRAERNQDRFHSQTRKSDQIFVELYKTKQRNIDLKTDDIEFERNKEHLTFRPNLSHTLKTVEINISNRPSYNSPSRSQFDYNFKQKGSAGMNQNSNYTQSQSQSPDKRMSRMKSYDRLSLVKNRDKQLRVLYTRFEKKFYKAYRQVLKLQSHVDNGGEINYAQYIDLSENQFYELLERLYFISRSDQNDMNLAREIYSRHLQNKLTRKGMLAFLCLVEDIQMSWMINEKEGGEENLEASQNDLQYGKYNAQGNYIVTLNEGQRISRRYESYRLRRQRALQTRQKQKADQISRAKALQERIAQQDRRLKLIFAKFVKKFDKAYRYVLRLSHYVEYGGETNYSNYVELSEEQFYELMERMYYINRNDENDMILVRDIPTKFLSNKLSRKNILTYLCLIDNIFLSWMRYQDEDENENDQEANQGLDQSVLQYGRFNNEGYYLVTERESQWILRRFEGLRMKRQRFRQNRKKAKADQYQRNKALAEKIEAQDRRLKLTYQKFEKKFNKAYRQVLGLAYQEYNDREQNYQDYVDLSEGQFFELMERLNFIDRKDENDMKLVRDVPSQLLQNRLNRRNILTYLCLVENIYMSWMRNDREDEGNEREQGAISYGRLNQQGYYLVSEQENLRFAKKFDSLRMNRYRFNQNRKQTRSKIDRDQQKSSLVVDKSFRKGNDKQRESKNESREKVGRCCKDSSIILGTDSDLNTSQRKSIVEKSSPSKKNDSTFKPKQEEKKQRDEDNKVLKANDNSNMKSISQPKVLLSSEKAVEKQAQIEKKPEPLIQNAPKSEENKKNASSIQKPEEKKVISQPLKQEVISNPVKEETKIQKQEEPKVQLNKQTVKAQEQKVEQTTKTAPIHEVKASTQTKPQTENAQQKQSEIVEKKPVQVEKQEAPIIQKNDEGVKRDHPVDHSKKEPIVAHSKEEPKNAKIEANDKVVDHIKQEVKQQIEKQDPNKETKAETKPQPEISQETNIIQPKVETQAEIEVEQIWGVLNDSDKQKEAAYKKLEEKFFKAYRQTLKLNQKSTNPNDKSEYVDLNEEQFYELMERQGFIDRTNSNDMKLLKDIPTKLFQNKLNWKNLLTYSCLIENIPMSWMINESYLETNAYEYGTVNSNGNYLVSSKLSLKVSKGFESYKLRRSNLKQSKLQAKAWANERDDDLSLSNFNKFQSKFDRAYRNVLNLDLPEDKLQDYSLYVDLSEPQFFELLEKLGFIDRKDANDMKLVKDVPTEILHKLLSRRNILTYLCSLQNIFLSWMKFGKIDSDSNQKGFEYGRINSEGFYVLSDLDRQRLSTRFDRLRTKRGRYLETRKLNKTNLRVKYEGEDQQYATRFNKIQKRFDFNYREVLKLELPTEKQSDYTLYKDLSEAQFFELIEKLGYIDGNDANDVKVMKEVSSEVLKYKLSRRNILTFVCILENIFLSWMRHFQEDSNLKNFQYGRINSQGFYVLSDSERQRVYSKYEGQRSRQVKYFDLTQQTKTNLRQKALSEDGPLLPSFNKYQRKFDAAYRDVLKLELSLDQEQDYSKYIDLSDDQLFELLERLNYIDRKNQNDMKIAKEIPTEVLRNVLSRKNILAFLCIIENTCLSWMKSYTLKYDNVKALQYGRINNNNQYIYSDAQRQRVYTRFESFRGRRSKYLEVRKQTKANLKLKAEKEDQGLLPLFNKFQRKFDRAYSEILNLEYQDGQQPDYSQYVDLSEEQFFELLEKFNQTTIIIF